MTVQDINIWCEMCRGLCIQRKMYWPRHGSTHTYNPCSASISASNAHSLHPEDVGNMVLW